MVLLEIFTFLANVSHFHQKLKYMSIFETIENTKFIIATIVIITAIGMMATSSILESAFADKGGAIMTVLILYSKKHSRTYSI